MLPFTLMPTATQPEKNRLYYGDNLQVLREYIHSESVDLIYLDPPFNSRQDSPILLTKLREGMSSTPFSLKENGTPQLLPCRSIRGMDCNVLFAEKGGTRSASQITAFKYSWEWNEEAARAYEESWK